jgi:hypothetical protein
MRFVLDVAREYREHHGLPKPLCESEFAQWKQSVQMAGSQHDGVASAVEVDNFPSRVSISARIRLPKRKKRHSRRV